MVERLHFHELHCVKSVSIRSFSGSYFTLHLSVFSPNAENAYEKNSEYGHFSRNDTIVNKSNKDLKLRNI